VASDPEGDRAARDAAVAALVYNLTGLALQAALILAYARRDWIGRQWARYSAHLRQEWRGSRERLMLADLRRDLSRMDHEGVNGAD
jgi:hypothetical protein